MHYTLIIVSCLLALYLIPYVPEIFLTLLTTSCIALVYCVSIFSLLCFSLYGTIISSIVLSYIYIIDNLPVQNLLINSTLIF